MNQNDLSPIISEQGLLIIGGAIVFLSLVAGISFTVLFKTDPSSVKAFRGGRILHYVTVLVVVFATVLLALERIMSGEAAASILGGIIGYVLGTLKKSEDEPVHS